MTVFKDKTGWIIVAIIASILPSLIASIIAGRISKSKKQAFISWMLVVILNGIILMTIFLIRFIDVSINGAGSFYQTSNDVIINSFFYFILLYVKSKISIVFWIYVFEILIGLFYSGFAVIFVKRNR